MGAGGKGGDTGADARELQIGAEGEATHQDAAREEEVLRVNDLFQRHLVLGAVLLVVREEVLEPQLFVTLFIAI